MTSESFSDQRTKAYLFSIRADKNISLQSFVDVLDVVKNLGFMRVSLQTEEKR
jgi:biopolymer transport protein ExbD